MKEPSAWSLLYKIQNIPLQLPQCGLCRTWHRSMPLVPVLCCVACTMWPSGLCCPAQIPNLTGNSANSSLQRSSSHPGPEVTQIMWPCPYRTVQRHSLANTVSVWLYICYIELFPYTRILKYLKNWKKPISAMNHICMTWGNASLLVVLSI